MRHETLLFVVDRSQNNILLAMKKVRFGAGKYNAAGGGIEEGESAATAAVRETREEVGIEVKEADLKHMGQINFSFEGKPEWERLVQIFVAERWAGEPTESDEMKPEWFALENIPYDKMWIDDICWLPKVLAGQSIDAAFHFAHDGSVILSQRVD